MVFIKKFCARKAKNGYWKHSMKWIGEHYRKILLTELIIRVRDEWMNFYVFSSFNIEIERNLRKGWDTKSKFPLEVSIFPEFCLIKKLIFRLI